MRLLKGAIIGIAAILPGASGGVIAVSMGVYRPVINAVVGFFKAVRRNALFLLPLGLGGVVGLFACLLYTSRSPRDKRQSRMPSSA